MEKPFASEISEPRQLDKILECVMKMPECPECGKSLVRQSTKCRYHCENDNCPVIYIRYPHVPALKVVVYESSKKVTTTQTS